MNILVINSGSSSLKYQLIEIETENILAKGLCERIGMLNSTHKYSKHTGLSVETTNEINSHVDAIEAMLKLLTDDKTGVLRSVKDIKAVGHRIVHGGEKFNDSVIIDDNVMKALRDCIDLAPLHNPANILGVEACQQEMPSIPMIGVFDTAFHQTMPDYVYMYALPYDLYKKYGIRKYGFHGTSHKYVSRMAAKILGKDLKETSIVSCHLGNGASICAIKNGLSIDTSMGFTPLAGLAMGTRSGTIDPALIKYIMEKEKMTIEQMNSYLNKQSGVLGISGISSDFRDLLAASNEGNERALLAIRIFAYRVKKYVSEYIGVMNGADAIVFTAGIGENNAFIRYLITQDLDFFGVKIDEEKNKLAVGMEMDISAPGSTMKVLVIPTNEELEIAHECKKLLCSG
ncbi:MAG: acetate kinase [Clostridia bacterium]